VTLRRRALAVAVLLASIARPAHAWNGFGHMAVAYVAYEHLTPSTRARVRTLLRKNPFYSSNWKHQIPAGTPTADADRMLFMIAATWPDQIKRDDRYHDDGTDGGDRPPSDGTAAQNVGYADQARHKYWHFIDTPFSPDGTPLPPVPTPNAGTQIASFRATLASRDPDALKSYDLSWLLHLVGDVHQPLHCATRVSAGRPGGDYGGNGVKLSCRGCSSLHLYWDGLLGPGDASPEAVIAVARSLPVPDATAAAKHDAKDWIAESFQLARDKVYAPPIGVGDGPYQPTTGYRNAARALARKRIALAGVRLANLLNDELR